MKIRSFKSYQSSFLRRRYIFASSCIFVICIAGLLSAHSQNLPPKDSRFYEAQAVKDYQAKDFPAFLQNMKLAESLRPNHPRLLYNLADAYALNGKTAEAIFNLNKLVAMKLFFRVEKDEDFNSLKTSEEFQNIIKEFAANSLPVGNDQVAFTVREKGLVAESVAYDAGRKTFYLASAAQRKILSVDERGATKIFADRSDGLWSAMGIKIDEKRRLLWASTSAYGETPNLGPDEKGSSAVFKFDLKTGRLIKKYILANKPKAHGLGDLTIAPNGDVYATDSSTPVIYVVRQDTDEIEPFLENESFSSLQGLDFTPDGKFLLAADYGNGVFRINTKTKETINLAPAPDSTMFGIDGIYFYKNSLIAVQNGVAPQRIIRFFLSKNLDKVERFKVLAANNPVFDDITLGVISGNQFYFIADAQWNLLGESGRFAEPDKLKDATVVKISLDEPKN